MGAILLFDFDGTLADSETLGIRLYNTIAHRYGYMPITPEHLPHLRRQGALTNIRLAGIPLWHLPLITYHMRRALYDHRAELAPFPGISDALRTLQSQGHTMHIVTSNSSATVGSFLDQNDMRMFAGVHSVWNLFGKGARIRSLVAQYGWDPRSVVYIGDELRDIDAARAAGVRSVAVAWGYTDHTALAALNPESVLDSPTALPCHTW